MGQYQATVIRKAVLFCTKQIPRSGEVIPRNLLHGASAVSPLYPDDDIGVHDPNTTSEDKTGIQKCKPIETERILSGEKSEEVPTRHRGNPFPSKSRYRSGSQSPNTTQTERKEISK
jgi:hypothetical protein